MSDYSPTPEDEHVEPEAPVVADLFKRRVALGVVGALVLVGVGTGTAVALAESRGSTSPSTTIINEGWAPGYGNGNGSGSSGTGPGWPGTPPGGSFGSGGAGDGGDGTPETAGDATAAQSAGLVEITSTLANGKAAGTGLVFSSDGLVVTNHHVVAGATSVKVTVVATGRTYSATYVGGDTAADVAVLRLSGASGLTTAKLASTAAATGDGVTAVGDAGGNGGSLTASPGTVRATGQHITVQNDDGTSSSLTGLIEVAAYVVPGDSGGALLDRAGQVVGMNVAASSGGRDVTGYSIPIATVRSVVDQIVSGRQSATISRGYHGYLGVGLQPTSTTPRVVQVENGGAADRAGIVVGDTITSVNGTRVTSSVQLRSLLAKTAPGDRATIGWKTASGAAHTATMTLGRAPIA